MKNLHSFTLDPKESQAVSKIKRGKKSGFVSDAIVKYSKYQSWHISVDRSKTPEEMRFYQNEDLISKFNKKCIEVLELRKALELSLLASKPKRSLINRLFSSNDE